MLGVSLDTVDSHKKFCTKEGLNFRLLADTNHKVTESYGSLSNFGVVKFAARNTFVIDPQGKIEVVIGKPQAQDSNALDTWMANHAREP